MNCDVNLGLPADLAAKWAVGRESSAACFPEDGVFFLQEGFIKEIVTLSGLCPEAQPAFFAAAAQIRSTPELLAFAWHCHWRLNVAPAAINAEHNPWPPKKADFTVMGNQFFFVFPILAALPRLKAYYAERGIPARILADTLHDLDVWAHTTHDLHGVWGYRDPRWLLNHTAPNLFRLGRLQFQFGKRNNPCNTWRKTDTGQVVIFPPDGLPATEDGFFAHEDEPQAFATIYNLDADQGTVTGTPVRPDGRIDQHPITLPLEEWKQPFINGDQMITIHIPAGAPLDFDACRDSLRQAIAFYPRFFPDFQFKALQCGSWLFDPQLADYLPAQSNLIRFQTLFHRYPMVNGSSWQIRERVFGDPELPLDKVPQKTSLQKIVKKHLQEGRQWRSGCVITLPEEIA